MTGRPEHPARRYAAGGYLLHPRLGVGRVVEVRGAVADVYLTDGRAVLVSLAESAPLTPGQARDLVQAVLHAEQQPDGWAPWVAAGSERCYGGADTAPRRVKISRRHPDPPNTKRVVRPSKWGNPHPVGHCGPCGVRHTRGEAVRLFAAELVVGALAVSIADVRAELAGWNLGCWCDLEDACHADVLLAVANGGGV